MATAPKRLSPRILLPMVGALASLAFGATAAHGAAVEVRETLGAQNTAELIFQALPAEDNQVTITFTKGLDGYFDLTVKDAGAPLSPGSGCSGGGEAGEEAHCRMHAPKWQDFEHCGKNCLRPIPGTGWTDTLRISLGDGNNTFDGSAFSEPYPGVDMNVESGAGEDEIVLGAGEDRVDPGAGTDQVHTGVGFDRIKATAVADGPDLYDAGPSSDKLSYELRGEPVYLAGSIAGAAGEGDTLVGAFHLIGGTGNDVLEGGVGHHVLEGGPGNDILKGTWAEGTDLFGGSGDDQLSTAGAGADSFNHLIGEGGNDTYLGGEGGDWIFENNMLPRTDAGARPEASPFPESSGGDDVAYGEGKRDMIALGTGADRIFGGEGNDEIDGESGADRIRGGPGRDQLVGGFGFDRLYGGRGSDRLFSGRTQRPVPNFVFPEAVDDGRDRVDCGPGRDVGNVNPWDRRFRCETTHLLRRRASTGS